MEKSNIKTFVPKDKNKEEKNSLCPNSFAPMPVGKFHNFAIFRGETN